MKDKFRNSEEMLSAYYDGELSPEEEKQFAAFLEQESIGQELEEVQQLESFEQMGQMLRSWSHHESLSGSSEEKSAELWARIDAQLDEPQRRATEARGLRTSFSDLVSGLAARFAGEGFTLSPSQFGGVVAVAMLFAFYAGVMSNGAISPAVSPSGNMQLASNGVLAGSQGGRDLRDMSRSPGREFDTPNQFVSSEAWQGMETMSDPTFMSRLPGTSEQLLSSSGLPNSGQAQSAFRGSGSSDSLMSFVSSHPNGQNSPSHVGMPIGERSFRRTIPLHMSTEQLLSQDAVPGGFRVGKFDFEWIEAQGTFEILSRGDERIAPIVWVRSVR
jgi:hypothetical protein